MALSLFQNEYTRSIAIATTATHRTIKFINTFKNCENFPHRWAHSLPESYGLGPLNKPKVNTNRYLNYQKSVFYIFSFFAAAELLKIHNRVTSRNKSHFFLTFFLLKAESGQSRLKNYPITVKNSQ